MTPRAALFDVDGTLVDTNYHHTLAWSRAFARYDLCPPLWRIHRAIGMGGDQLVAAVAGERAEQDHGDQLRDAWAEEYEPLLREVHPFDGAHDLIHRVKDRGHLIVLASSAPKEHLTHYLDLLGASNLIDEVTSADDADRTKPAPELVEVAMAKSGTHQAIMIGDSTWDAIAAKRADVSTIAVRTGGFSSEELHDAGAKRVYDSLTDLTADLDNTELA